MKKHPLQTYLNELGYNCLPLEEVDSLRAKCLDPKCLTANIWSISRLIQAIIRHQPQPEIQKEIEYAIFGVNFDSTEGYVLFPRILYSDD